MSEGCEVQKQAPIAEVLNRTKNNLQGLEEAIKSLTERLKPVLLLEPKQSAVEEKNPPEPAECPLNRVLIENNKKIEGLTTRIYEIREALQI